jgi:hypothetical protein
LVTKLAKSGRGFAAFAGGLNVKNESCSLSRGIALRVIPNCLCR